jgi:outer membrane lipoprotein SlyB
MFTTCIRRNVTTTLVGLAIVGTVGLSQASAQNRNWQPVQVVEAGTRVSVRTTRAIDERELSRRVFTGIVDEDVLDSRGRLAIPRGAAVELMVRSGRNRELYLDLESISMNGQWYGVDATKRAIEGRTRVDSTIGNNQETAEHVGGGALIGSIIGAIVGGGKGAAVGAIAGAGVGAATQMQVHGEVVRVPAESLVTFRLESPLTLGWKDTGHDRDGAHYHDDRR